MYECTCKTIESSELINITTFDQNQFMTCYLIFNFRPTYFSYFQKIIANSNSHNVKKQVEKKFHPRSQGVKVTTFESKLNFRGNKLILRFLWLFFINCCLEISKFAQKLTWINFSWLPKQYNGRFNFRIEQINYKFNQWRH